MTIHIDQHTAFTEETPEDVRSNGLHDPRDYIERAPLLPPMKDQALTEMTTDELLDSCRRVRDDLDAAVEQSRQARGEFIGCPWCTIRTQGCRCATPCGAEHCDRATVPLPAHHTRSGA